MEENQCVMLGCNHLCECLGLEQCYHPIWKQAQATPERRLFQLVPSGKSQSVPLQLVVQGCQICRQELRRSLYYAPSIWMLFLFSP